MGETMDERVFNVLFLCTGNAARSLIAEAILNREGAGRFHAFSAGTAPAAEADPMVLKLLASTNYATGGLHPKSWDAFAAPDAPEMDFVFTVCDSAASEPCPQWPGQPMTAHWSLPDPETFAGSETERAALVADIMRMLNTRIGIFCALPIRGLDRLALQRRLDAIGTDA